MSKARKANWSDSETQTLVCATVERLHMLEGKFSSTLTSLDKSRGWESIMESVNATSMIPRSVDEVKKKWADVKSQTKKKERERRRQLKQTGGGPSPSHLKEWEEMIVGVLKEVVMEGIEGGVDTFAIDRDEEKPIASSSVESLTENGPQDDPQTDQKSDQVYQTETMQRKRKRNTRKESCECTSKLIRLEEEKLELMKQFLQIEKEKLKILKERGQQQVFMPEGTLDSSPIIKLKFA